jgi:polygalacturonase
MRNWSVLLLELASMTFVPAGTAAAQAPEAGTCDVARYGAPSDGRTLASAAIQKAIDSCAGRGGGIVLLASGTFLSGTIIMRDNITLRILPGATLLASPRIEDFKPFPAEDVPAIMVDGSTQNKGNGPYHLVHAANARNIAIDGGGTINGNGEAYWDKDPVRFFVSRQPRPTPLIEFVESEQIRIENIHIRDAAGWTIHPLESSDIRIVGVTIRNEGRGPNTDAINIDSSHNVLVSDANIVAGDDCAVLKTTGRRGQRPPPATYNVKVSGVICSSDDQGIKIGTESLGDFRDIIFDNILIYHTPSLYRAPTAAISLSMVDGARFDNVIVNNVIIRDAATPLFLRLGNRGRGQARPVPGSLKGVIFSNIVATGGSLASSITGLPNQRLNGITLRDIDFTMKGGGAPMKADVPEADGDYPHAPMFGALPASGLYVRHVDGLTMQNVRLGTDAPDGRPALVLDDVTGADLDAISTRNLHPR